MVLPLDPVILPLAHRYVERPGSGLLTDRAPLLFDHCAELSGSVHRRTFAMGDVNQLVQEELVSFVHAGGSLCNSHIRWEEDLPFSRKFLFLPFKVL